ncbi:MAG: ribonuclease E/G [Anaerococcus hydrogenalis]|uniref:ribonuclease E/G n=1 Tax=Anaerococcus hydrogenalis TaxID=33029 RepID=UPI002587B815|nr:ribonuclease E/G [Anaerococcus hydrogenalis]MDU3153196.1 ribonuclease E/G [Anaerococcus hydrogenalis]MDU3687254.1 ribonuclease E/G [Anaerococcus hydrogenalis]
MKSYIFVDYKEKAFGKIVDDKLYELKFYSPYLYNIYRAKVVDKIDSINAYFLLYDKDKKAFLKSNKKFKIGDSVIGQIVKEEFDDKLARFSANFRIENEDYYLYRFKNKGYPILKKGRNKNSKNYKNLIDTKNSLINEENFNPTPKLLKTYNEFDLYLEKNKNLSCKEIDIKNNKIIFDSIKTIKDEKIYQDDLSIIINDLETLCFVDVNSSKKKSTMDKDDFYYKVNEEVIDFIFYNLKLRNIGGMIVIDFLKSTHNEKLLEIIKENIEKYFKIYTIYGFTNMGLFELSIKREGQSLVKKLKEKKLI